MSLPEVLLTSAQVSVVNSTAHTNNSAVKKAEFLLFCRALSLLVFSTDSLTLLMLSSAPTSPYFPKIGSMIRFESTILPTNRPAGTFHLFPERAWVLSVLTAFTNFPEVAVAEHARPFLGLVTNGKSRTDSPLISGGSLIAFNVDPRYFTPQVFLISAILASSILL
jgi:hypothetical protein